MELCKECDKKFVKQGLFLAEKDMCPSCREKVKIYTKFYVNRQEKMKLGNPKTKE